MTKEPPESVALRRKWTQVNRDYMGWDTRCGEDGRTRPDLSSFGLGVQ